ncbi:phospholipase/carboxylesterase [Roseiarcus fermentans]|uniref:Phospholipase/carboxylesterase n=1 Tax=Roseiarcus fermentans TaxID=1473586 RepID=A0A366FNC1_9HYPH|nr:prolyl oligopeptidase family serine peptidase [Roseiarcus fermentans]RBP16194.1 phospholipase/carboxylesterase [Roseiarcus fermentans]
MPSAPDSLVILLHGVGSDGADMIPIGEALAGFLPGARFVAPDAPFSFDGGGMGRQWFSIVGVDADNRAARVAAARAGFDRVVAHEIARAGFGDRLGRVALFGFSQGAILSLDALVDGRWPVGAVVAASGRLVGPVGPNPARVPTLLLHGEGDDVIPAAETVRAERILGAAGLPVEAHVFPGLGHSVSPKGLQTARAFLSRALAPTAA